MGNFSDREWGVLRDPQQWRKLVDAGFAATVADIAERGLDAASARRCLHFVWLSSVLDALKSTSPEVARFNGDVHRATVEGFCKADTTHIASAPQRIRRLVAERVTEARSAFPKEAELLAHQARLKRRHKTVRQLSSEAPHVLAALKPCWAMSPLLVAQLLPNGRQFDVVVFDEASQVTPAGAIGALARAPQAVVAGDRKQLPPTPFFISSAGDSEEDATETVAEGGDDFTENIESVLDVMGSLFPPPNGTRTLEWHYRSRDERLIAFSNAHALLYDHALMTFPGTSIDGAVTHVLVPHIDGHHDKTASSTAEVARVAELVAAHALARPHESLGVIAFGIGHANRIEEWLRLARKTDAALDAFMESMPGDEPFFVKNLERVQGDERDAIILSVGYCKTPDGRMHYNFGPINRDGGFRRLNVAVTRAKQRMTVVSSFSSTDMDPARLTSDGPKMLRDFLEYAESGGTNLGEHSRSHVELNPFERDVTEQLTRAGIPLVAQYGASGYWIDFAATHPTRPGQMVLAIEADGAMYHSQPSARNRDRLRQEHLERLGWRFHRIWSQEWFLHREHEVEKALAEYKAAVELADHPQSLGPGALATSDPTSTTAMTGPPRTPAGSATHASDVSSDGASPTATPAADVPPRSGPFPLQRHLPISAYSLPQLVTAVRWVESDTLLRTDDELFEAVLHELGFQRRGRLITEAIERAIATAHAGQPSRRTKQPPPSRGTPGLPGNAVKFDLSRWSANDIREALRRAKQWKIPYQWQDGARVLVIPAKYEEAAKHFVLRRG